MSHGHHSAHSESTEFKSDQSENGFSFEMKCGLMIAIFAAVMSISELFAGKYGDDEIMGTNEKSAAYQWYQSKSIKQSLMEGQKDLLQSLVDGGAVQSTHLEAIKIQIHKLETKINKYDKDKNEILLGSEVVGKENWSQEVDGELGKVIGAKQIESQVTRLSVAGDRFDLATLFYQICLVAGAVSLVMKNRKLQYMFFTLMSVLGVIGIGFSISAAMAL